MNFKETCQVSQPEKELVTSSLMNFPIDGLDLENLDIRPIKTGFLHDSYCVADKSNNLKYVVQRLRPVFNLQAVNTNLKLFEKAQAESASFLPEYWQPVYYVNVASSSDKIYYDAKGHAWRVMEYVPREIRIFDSFNQVPKEKKEEIAYSLGEAIAIFGKTLTLVPQDKWQEPLPNFHNAAYHYNYLQAILKGEEVSLSLSHDPSQKVRRQEKFLKNYSQRIDLLLSEIEKKRGLVSCLDGLGARVTHGDLKINNAVFRQDRQGKWHCVALIDLDTIQLGGALDDLGDALRSAGNPVGEQPPSLDLVSIDKAVVEHLIAGFLEKTSQFEGVKRADQLRRCVYQAFAQFLYVQGIRFFADALVGNRYFRLNEKEPEDLNLYRAEVQIRTLQELEKVVVFLRPSFTPSFTPSRSDTSELLSFTKRGRAC